MDLQKANLGKRFIAAVFDGILLSVLAVGLATLISFVIGYNGYVENVEKAYAKYEAEYGVELELNQQEYEKLSEQEREVVDAGLKALNADKEAVYSRNMMINLMLLMATFSVLISVLIIEFFVPLIFGNGQTLGKKIFGIGIMHVEGIKVSNVQLFARTVLGKFAIEIMIPLAIILMVSFNSIGMVAAIIMVSLLLFQIISLIATRTNSLLHDMLAGTVTVDIASQRIFETEEELIEYTKKIHAERAARAIY